MAWDFSTDVDVGADVSWARDFIDHRVERVAPLVRHGNDLRSDKRNRLIRPLQQEVRRHGLWAPHLDLREGGGQGAQVRLALLNEAIGRSRLGPVVFGCQTPDAGSMETIAKYAQPEVRKRYLKPLVDNEVTSAFSMTEPEGGSDPGSLRTTAELHQAGWVINGEKWFTTNARFADFVIVMCRTAGEDTPARDRMTMFVVPAGTPGLRVIRNVGMADELPGEGVQGYMAYDGVVVPDSHRLGDVGGGFQVAQDRLRGGRLHHAMRTVGLMQRTFEMLCRRAVSRTTRGAPLADNQLIQEMIAASWTELECLRLLTLQTAWKIDQTDGDYTEARAEISAVKVLMQKVAHDISARAIQVHGSLGVTDELPLVRTLLDSFRVGIADGPTEIHTLALARSIIRRTEPDHALFTKEHLPTRLEVAAVEFGERP